MRRLFVLSAFLMAISVLPASVLPASAQGGPGTENFPIRNFGACINLPDFTIETEPDQYNTIFEVPGLFSINFAEYLLPLQSLPATSDDIYNAMIALLDTVQAGDYQRISFAHPEYVSAAVEFTLDGKRMFGMIYRNQNDRLFFLFADKVEGFDMLAIGRAIFAADNTCTRIDDGVNPAPVVLVAEPVLVPGQPRTYRFEALPEHGYTWPFYLYVPRSVRHTHLLIHPNNSGSRSNDFAFHDTEALNWLNGVKSWGDSLGVPVMIPVFPRPEDQLIDGHISPQYLGRGSLEAGYLALHPTMTRHDLQLLAMIEDARLYLDEQGIETDSQVLLWGQSASGLFVTRFAALHPERVKAAVFVLYGWPVVPGESWDGLPLPYPYGLGDVTALTGAPFNLEVFQQIAFMSIMGGQDTNTFAMPWYIGPNYSASDYYQAFVAKFGTGATNFSNAARSIFAAMGCNAEFVIYPELGHTLTAEIQQQSIGFFAAQLDTSP